MAEGTETRMKDIDGNFCDGNGRLLPQTGEEWQDKLRRERDQPKKQELPPSWAEEQQRNHSNLLKAPRELADMLTAKIEQIGTLRTQLRAALSDNEAKDARIAELEDKLTEARSGNVAWEDAVGSLEAHLMDRIAMNDPANPTIYLQILQADVRSVRRDTEAIRKATWTRERMYCASAEAAEAKLKSVEGMLEEPLTECMANVYDKRSVDALLARAREAVKGDK